jgi:alkylation response protein AidB-like acyl-CoA dehydrogenase
MNLAYDEDQEALRASVTQAADRAGGRRLLRRLIDGDESVLDETAELAKSGEWTTIALPEAAGGAGGRLSDLAAVFEALGHIILPGPVTLSLGLAAPLVLACPPSSVRDALLRSLASGDLVGAAVDPEQLPALSLHGTRARGDRAWFISPERVRWLLAWVPGDDGSAALVATPADAAGLQMSPEPWIDLSRPRAQTSWDEVEVEVLARGNDARNAVDTALRTWWALLAVESVGVADAALQAAVTYAGEREQFGRPIGSFQAVKHRCADMLVRVESARAAAYYAIAAIENDAADAAEAAHITQAIGAKLTTKVTHESIHVHGAMGFTWEHDCHLWVRRAKTNEIAWGRPAWHRRQLAVRLGIA